MSVIDLLWFMVVTVDWRPDGVGFLPMKQSRMLTAGAGGQIASLTCAVADVGAPGWTIFLDRLPLRLVPLAEQSIQTRRDIVVMGQDRIDAGQRRGGLRVAGRPAAADNRPRVARRVSNMRQ